MPSISKCSQAKSLIDPGKEVGVEGRPNIGIGLTLIMEGLKFQGFIDRFYYDRDKPNSCMGIQGDGWFGAILFAAAATVVGSLRRLFADVRMTSDLCPAGTDSCPGGIERLVGAGLDWVQRCLHRGAW